MGGVRDSGVDFGKRLYGIDLGTNSGGRGLLFVMDRYLLALLITHNSIITLPINTSLYYYLSSSPSILTSRICVPHTGDTKRNNPYSCTYWMLIVVLIYLQFCFI